MRWGTHVRLCLFSMTGVGWLLMLGLAEEGGCVVCGRREETNLASLLETKGHSEMKFQWSPRPLVCWRSLDQPVHQVISKLGFPGQLNVSIWYRRREMGFIASPSPDNSASCCFEVFSSSTHGFVDCWTILEPRIDS